MNLVLGAFISLILFYVAGIPIAPEPFITSLFLSFVIGYTAGDLGPVTGWSMGLINILHIKNAFVKYFITAIVFGLFFGTIILFGNSLVTNLSSGGWMAVFDFFLSYIGIVIGSAIVLILVFLKLIQKVAAIICGFNPRKAPVQETKSKPA